MRYVVRRRSQSRLMLTVAAVGVFAAACSGSSSGGASAKVATQSTTQAQSSAAAAGPVALTTHKGPLGTYLTDGQGRTVYMFAADKSGSSTCTGQCATYWPPVTGTAAHTSGAAVASMTGTISRPDGTMQITYAGHPLYLYAGDSKAGDTKGQGSDNFGAKWWLLDPQGKPITGAAPAAKSTTSSSGSGGSGWG
jgi:predicted lipoprotein with Yx(FWY)xxD motif